MCVCKSWDLSVGRWLISHRADLAPTSVCTFYANPALLISADFGSFGCWASCIPLLSVFFFFLVCKKRITIFFSVSVQSDLQSVFWFVLLQIKSYCIILCVFLQIWSGSSLSCVFFYKVDYQRGRMWWLRLLILGFWSALVVFGATEDVKPEQKEVSRTKRRGSTGQLSLKG